MYSMHTIPTVKIMYNTIVQTTAQMPVRHLQLPIVYLMVTNIHTFSIFLLQFTNLTSLMIVTSGK